MWIFKFEKVRSCSQNGIVALLEWQRDKSFSGHKTFALNFHSGEKPPQILGIEFTRAVSPTTDDLEVWPHLFKQVRVLACRSNGAKEFCPSFCPKPPALAQHIDDGFVTQEKVLKQCCQECRAPNRNEAKIFIRQKRQEGAGPELRGVDALCHAWRHGVDHRKNLLT